MDKKKYWIIRLFFVLFTMSVSVAILPCGIIKVHSLFGEITTYIWKEFCQGIFYPLRNSVLFRSIIHLFH